jgi:hypothetical protein
MSAPVQPAKQRGIPLAEEVARQTEESRADTADFVSPFVLEAVPVAAGAVFEAAKNDDRTLAAEDADELVELIRLGAKELRKQQNMRLETAA